MKKIITLSFLALTLIATTAFAHMGMGGCHCMGQMMQELNLTPDQQKQIQQIKDQMKSQMQSNREQMQSLRTQMQTLIKSDKIDEAKLDSLVNQKKELMGTMMKAKIKMKNQIYNLLDAQQKTKFASMMEQKMGMCPQGMGMQGNNTKADDMNDMDDND
ncbi:envelope stress induced periplasmic protein (plasmid) [Legionella adelaidensis]|uniref:Envelope stress induced periplasmic protein n=1 Tax=Legionella adelaidensis TaxID=45056 RepID=A0A0W0R4I6_9GAMM|nr:Spy/CpxP family protein refolding chaperone [Legionella adelaidensis]KTC65976.1 envelope stress induced periplasmic protein [Legionella adelaidensis]VEH86300.1 envelope stress induced periplasmic protein [Legionella adelaidensis]